MYTGVYLCCSLLLSGPAMWCSIGGQSTQPWSFCWHAGKKKKRKKKGRDKDCTWSDTLGTNQTPVVLPVPQRFALVPWVKNWSGPECCANGVPLFSTWAGGFLFVFYWVVPFWGNAFLWEICDWNQASLLDPNISEESLNQHQINWDYFY